VVFRLSIALLSPASSGGSSWARCSHVFRILPAQQRAAEQQVQHRIVRIERQAQARLLLGALQVAGVVVGPGTRRVVVEAAAFLLGRRGRTGAQGGEAGQEGQDEAGAEHQRGMIPRISGRVKGSLPLGSP
jgi:hypothetical protein